MKMTHITAAALLGIASIVSFQPSLRAQDKPPRPPGREHPGGPGRSGGPGGPGERMQQMASELHLTPEQREQLKPVFQEMMEKMRELHQNPNLTPQERMEKMKAIREEMAPKFKQVLTPEQMQKWQQLRGQQPAAGAGPMDRLHQAIQELNLTPEQKEKLKPIFQEQMQKFKAVREDSSLSPQERMEKFKAMREQVMPQLKQVLTPEQFQKLQLKFDQARGQFQKRIQERHSEQETK